MALSYWDLMRAVDRSRTILRLLLDKYPELKVTGPYLMFGTRFGQCELGISPSKFLDEFPEMVIDNEAVEELAEVRLHLEELADQRKNCLHWTRLAKKPPAIDRIVLDDGSEMTVKELEEEAERCRQEIVETERALHEYEQALEFDPEVEVGFRFEQLNFDLIRKLQSDPLVDHSRSTPGSIRVVLGTIGALAAHDSSPD